MRAEPDPHKGQSGDVSPWAIAGLGIQFGVALIAFSWIGQWADQKLDTAPFGLLIGVFVGGGGTFYASYRRLMAAQYPTATPPKGPPSPPSEPKP